MEDIEVHLFTCVICGRSKPFNEFGVLSDWGDCCGACLREALRSFILQISKFYVVTM